MHFCNETKRPGLRKIGRAHPAAGEVLIMPKLCGHRPECVGDREVSLGVFDTHGELWPTGEFSILTFS
jgi:hypothetical protein